MSTGDPTGGGEHALAAAMAGEIAALANQMFADPIAMELNAAPSPASAPPAAAAPSPPLAAAPSVAGADPAFASPPAVTPGVTALAPVMAAAEMLPATPEPTPVHAAELALVRPDVAEPIAASPPGGGLGAAPPEEPSGVPYFLEIAGPRPEAGAPAIPAAAAPPSSALPYEVRVESVPAIASAPSLIDPHAVRRDFPILEERVRGRRLVWLDNAATTQKPRAVIDRLSYFYEHENSNVHRAAHTLAARATDAYEGARDKVRRFLNAPSAREIVFARGATEAINLVAQSWGRRNVGPGDEIVVTHLEHHANIVPWQQLCTEKGARLRVAPVDSTGQVILEEYEKLLGPRARIVAFTQVSNALGTIVPAGEMIAMAHRHGARVLLDGAQAVSHMPVDVQALDCDFYVFSGHKIFAPTGIGALFGKAEVLEAMPPWQGGGNMIADVTFEKTLYQPPPARFEAGTGNIADAVGLGAALDYVESLGRANIDRYEHELRVHAEACLSAIPGLRIIGTAREKAGVISFVLDGARTEEVGGMLDQEGIAVRSGHHCAQPILRRFGLEATVRASLAPYNTREDVEALAAAVRRIQIGRV